MKPFILTLLLLTHSAFAFDLKLANGRVLQSVKINNVSPTGVTITPSTFGASATIYYWNLIDPEQHAFLKELGEKIDNEARKVDAVMDSVVDYKLEITQVQEGGFLATATHELRSFIKKSGVEYDEYVELDDPLLLFVACKPGSDMHDGQKLAGKLYRCGVYKYVTVMGSEKTVPRFAATAEEAVELK